MLSFRRAKIMAELNYIHRPREPPRIVFWNNLPKQMKDISETNKVGFAISKKSFTPSSNISIPHHKIPQNKI